ncbi:hypothetical protein JOL62DRAFT_630081 [Phyllosticta paracitricarpa]|uniref:Uncharacterized protein n=1 Tax=Phyllosticta paracitricarpa TaxID=2016321 RepID=A0ABR1MW40_9PEZI
MSPGTDKVIADLLQKLEDAKVTINQLRKTIMGHETFLGIDVNRNADDLANIKWNAHDDVQAEIDDWIDQDEIDDRESLYRIFKLDDLNWTYSRPQKEAIRKCLDDHLDKMRSTEEQEEEEEEDDGEDNHRSIYIRARQRQADAEAHYMQRMDLQVPRLAELDGWNDDAVLDAFRSERNELWAACADAQRDTLSAYLDWKMQALSVEVIRSERAREKTKAKGKQRAYG